MLVLAHLLILGTPLAAQVHTTITLDTSSLKKVDSPQDTASRAKAAPAGMISADLLRQPLPAKARRTLLNAQKASDAGDHTEAVRLYVAALAKYPQSAAWTQSLLGVEYLKMDQFEAAVASFDEAVRLLPRDAVNRSNLGLTLVLSGQYVSARRELKQALELDPANVQAKQLLDALQGKGVKSVAQAHE